MCANIWKVSWAKSSFYFRGPEEKLNLRAQNLMVFIQLAEGVDDVTWLHHLHQGDYAHWFRDVIKDADLAEETIEIGKRQDLSAREPCLVKTAIEKRYSASMTQEDMPCAGSYCRLVTTPSVPDNAVLHAHTPLAAR